MAKHSCHKSINNMQAIEKQQKKTMVAESRNYIVKTVRDAKVIATSWLKTINLENVITLGLPEIDDRYHVWRIPLKRESQKSKIGEIVVDAYSALIDGSKTTKPKLLETRLLKKDEETIHKHKNVEYSLSPLRNTIGLGNSGDLLEDMPALSVDLVFTSPPYFNARPEYTEYEEYELYLHEMRQIIRKTYRVLADGRFFVMNTSPVLLRRATRSEASRRIAVPFDLHRIFIEEGFEFIDDIIWVKPEGAGWATGRGRRFAADRNPMQYKAVPVTEYVMVYRKKTNLLIDWFIRNHPDREIIEASKIPDGYEKTNIWRIQPNTNSKHPAAFPKELAEKVIRYYSFRNDVVLDPFAGSGTVGAAAVSLNRRFVLFDINEEYVRMICQDAQQWLKGEFDNVLLINCEQSCKRQQFCFL